MAVLSWPSAFVVPQKVVFHPSSRSRSGGAGLDGQEQVVSHPFGVWTATVEAVWIHDKASELARRRLLMKLAGRAGAVRVPVFDCALGPALPFWPSPVPKNGVPHDDGTLFDDGAGYDFRPFVEGAIAVSAARQTISLRLTMAAPFAAQILPGHYMTTGTALDRLHLIHDVEAISGGVAITFWPPLREAAGVGQRVVFDHRVCCRMRLIDDGEGRMGLANGIDGDLSLSFVEAF